MRFKAEYMAGYEKLGVRPGEVHEIELNTYNTAHGSPYLWVQVVDSKSDYLMPFGSLIAFSDQWHIIPNGYEVSDQHALEDAWLEMYVPDEGKVEVQ